MRVQPRAEGAGSEPQEAGGQWSGGRRKAGRQQTDQCGGQRVARPQGASVRGTRVTTWGLDRVAAWCAALGPNAGGRGVRRGPVTSWVSPTSHPCPSPQAPHTLSTQCSRCLQTARVTALVALGVSRAASTRAPAQ